jgi:hypothetical protein
MIEIEVSGLEKATAKQKVPVRRKSGVHMEYRYVGTTDKPKKGKRVPTMELNHPGQGTYPANAASEIKVGDRILHNSRVNTVTNIEQKPRSLEFTMQLKDGRMYKQKFKKGAPVVLDENFGSEHRLDKE